ncbi:MAG TPA: hypothetical protein VKU00_21670, partial [Chthonomonadaceae bacterium]|nr:hypothetical protein [Chthonomonadaceae bacterium]
RSTHHSLQQVTIANTGTTTITGPLSLVLDHLSANVALNASSGVTMATNPNGSPYLNSGGDLAAGASVILNLDFTNPTLTTITYTPRVLAGPGPR